MSLPFLPWWHRVLPALWQGHGAMVRLLTPLSRLYGMAERRARAHALAHPETPRLPVPVLVIGNVVAGGAGKTPTTIAVAQYFHSLGVPVGIVSRGYGRSPKAPEMVVVHADSDAMTAGDEPVLIHLRTGAPVVVCANRTQAGHTLLRLHPQVRLILCDDGLQHHALQRDGEICVMDERGIGNGLLLPAGPLREPWPRRVDMMLYTAPPTTPVPVVPGQAVYHSRRTLHAQAMRANGTTCPLAHWRDSGQPVIAVAGIAQPERFFSMLEQQGLSMAQRHALPDHVGQDALASLARQWMSTSLPVLCTEKDAVKLWDVDPSAWAVPLVLEPEKAFFAALNAWWLSHAAHPGRAAAPSVP
ncbi:tetraacyldisaccharide 4'-kinase [Brachymonas sp. M4Q-1]|uniref:tetraacyldisaccharide 4'-kinase n=1 Tax=Brachymonas sp. M4Q-1 TaxID=3416906 RepID=UPI003CFB9E4C